MRYRDVPRPPELCPPPPPVAPPPPPKFPDSAALCSLAKVLGGRIHSATSSLIYWRNQVGLDRNDWQQIAAQAIRLLNGEDH